MRRNKTVDIGPFYATWRCPTCNEKHCTDAEEMEYQGEWDKKKATRFLLGKCRKCKQPVRLEDCG